MSLEQLQTEAGEPLLLGKEMRRTTRLEAEAAIYSKLETWAKTTTGQEAEVNLLKLETKSVIHSVLQHRRKTFIASNWNEK